MGYALIEPFGQDRADDGARMLGTLLYNANRAQGAKAVVPSDLLQPWRPQEVIEEAARLERLAAWFDARVVPLGEHLESTASLDQ